MKPWLSEWLIVIAAVILLTIVAYLTSRDAFNTDLDGYTNEMAFNGYVHPVPPPKMIMALREDKREGKR